MSSSFCLALRSASLASVRSCFRCSASFNLHTRSEGIHTHRQTDRQRHTQTDRQTDKDTHTHTHTKYILDLFQETCKRGTSRTGKQSSSTAITPSASPPLRLLHQLDGQLLRLPHLLLHQPLLLLGLHGRHLQPLALLLGVGRLVGQQLGLFLRYLGLLRQQVGRLLGPQLVGGGEGGGRGAGITSALVFLLRDAIDPVGCPFTLVGISTLTDI